MICFLFASCAIALIIYRLQFHPLAKFPGPKLTAITTLYEMYFDCFLGGKFSKNIDEMYAKYGMLYSKNNCPDLTSKKAPLFASILGSFTLKTQNISRNFTTERQRSKRIHGTTTSQVFPSRLSRPAQRKCIAIVEERWPRSSQRLLHQVCSPSWRPVLQTYLPAFKFGKQLSQVNQLSFLISFGVMPPILSPHV